MLGVVLCMPQQASELRQLARKRDRCANPNSFRRQVGGGQLRGESLKFGYAIIHRIDPLICIHAAQKHQPSKILGVQTVAQAMGFCRAEAASVMMPGKSRDTWFQSAMIIQPAL